MVILFSLFCSVYLHLCRVCPDGSVGTGKAQELPQGVQVPSSAEGHCSLPSLETEEVSQLWQLYLPALVHSVDNRCVCSSFFMFLSFAAMKIFLRV